MYNSSKVITSVHIRTQDGLQLDVRVQDVEGVQEEEGRISRILNASSQSITVSTQ